MATDWQVSEVGDTCRAAARPSRRRSVQIEWLSAGTAHLGFPALSSVPHLLSREIKMNRRQRLRTMPGGSIGRSTCCWPTLTLDTSWNSIIPLYPAGNMHFEFFELYLSIINQVLLVPSSVYRLIIIIIFFFIMCCIARNFVRNLISFLSSKQFFD